MTKPFILRTPDWQDDAACLGDDVRRAFPRTKEMAREFIHDNCDRCPVLEQCGEWADRFDVKDGVWGGVLRGRVYGETA